MQATLTLSDGREIKIDEAKLVSIIEAETKKKPTVAFDGTLLQVIDGYFIDSSMPTTDIERIVRLISHDEVDWACFDTREHAKEFDNRMQALYHIKKWVAENDNGFVPDWGKYEETKHFVMNNAGELSYDSTRIYNGNPDFPFMSCYEVTIRCMDECKEHLEIYFRVKK